MTLEMEITPVLPVSFQVFDLNKDKTVDMQEFVTVAALNDKLCGNM